MPKYFPSISHSKVRTVENQKAMDKMNGLVAFVDVYMGPGENSIGYIAIKKIAGPVTHVNAFVPRTPVYTGEKLTYIPVFQGEPAEELKEIALKAFDRVASKFGLKFSKTYKVDAKNVEEIGDNHAVGGSRLGEHATV